MAKTKLTSTPVYCASCYQQDPTARHIDFSAAYDGPVIPGSPKIVIDDLILCEKCLQTAFDILDPQGLKVEIERLVDFLETADADIRAKDVMITRLERTLHELVEHPVKHKQGAQAYAGVSDEVRKELDIRRKQRAEGIKHAKAAMKKQAEQEKAEATA